MGEVRQTDSVKVTAEGQLKLLEAKSAQGNHKGRKYTFIDIAEKAHCGEKTASRFCNGKENVSYETAVAICRALDVNIEDVIEAIPSYSQYDWRKICLDMFAAQKEKFKTRRGLLNPERELSVYVPLGLVKPNPKKSKYPDELLDSSQGMQQYAVSEDQIEKTFEHDAFLSEIVDQSPKSVVIIGEPGAGKSTWMEKIGEHLEVNQNLPLPIFVSLSLLNNQSLEDYLCDVWLVESLKISNITNEIITEFKNLFLDQKVCLLLDGLDELNTENPIPFLVNSLQGWLGSVRVFLSCRLNVWEITGKQSFPTFAIFRSQSFSDEQVDNFIEQWHKNDVEQAQKLINQLKEERTSRLRNLVKNPLRLVMLCSVWEENQGLPETKADLYSQFVTFTYNWKRKEFPISESEEENLNQSLGELAKRMIDEERTLDRSFVLEVLQEKFELAKKLGWLNQVGVILGKPVYAFYHLTFAEYFAACVIDDWDYFSPRNHTNYPVQDKKYRIFDKQWEEVYLFWMGRQDIEEQKKEKCIDNLMNFSDAVDDFYTQEAYFKSILGMNEIGRLESSIVNELLEWSFGYFNKEENQWIYYRDCLKERAEKLLLRIFNSSIIDHFHCFFNTITEPEVRFSYLNFTGKIFPYNPQTLQILVEILKNSPESFLNYYCSKDIMQNTIPFGHQESIKLLENFLKEIYNDTRFTPVVRIRREICREKIAYTLRKIDPDFLDKLYWLITQQKSYLKNIQLVEKIGIFSTHNDQKNIDLLIELLHEQYNNEDLIWEILSSLSKISSPNNIKITTSLFEILDTIIVEKTCYPSLYPIFTYLPSFVGVDDLQAVNKIIEIVNGIEITDEDIYMYTASAIERILSQSSQKIIDLLITYLQKSSQDWVQVSILKSIFKFDPQNEYAKTILMEILKTSSDDEALSVLTEEFYHPFGYGSKVLDQKLISELLELFHLNTDLNSRDLILTVISGIDFREKRVIDLILSILSNSREKELHFTAFQCFKKIPLNPDDYIMIVEKLSKIWCSEDSEFEELYGIFYELLWYCMENLSYEKFYYAWHSMLKQNQSSKNLHYLPEYLTSIIRKKIYYLDYATISDLGNPSLDYYDQLESQGYQAIDNEPDTLQKLQRHWNKTQCQQQQKDFLILYSSQQKSDNYNLNPEHLRIFGKFGEYISAITTTPNEYLQTFDPHDPNLLDNLQKWINRIQAEQ